jgi:hypothetical protein
MAKQESTKAPELHVQSSQDIFPKQKQTASSLIDQSKWQDAKSKQ